MINILKDLRQAFPTIDWHKTDDIAPERVEAHLGGGVRLVVSCRLYHLRPKDPWGTRELWYWAQILVSDPLTESRTRGATHAIEDGCPVKAVRRVFERCEQLAAAHAYLKTHLRGETSD